MKYKVNEIFTTIQGEATYAGTPSHFIRLQGCDIGCSFCDTKHTWAADNKNLCSLKQLIKKQSEDDSWSLLSAEEIFFYLKQSYCRHIVITGGEPCIQDLTGLTTLFYEYGYQCQIETSGAYEIKCHQNTFVTLSPKHKYKKPLKSSITRANEVKIPVGKKSDIDIAQYYFGLGKTVWLQPISQQKKATQLCVDACIEYGFFKISVQTHKYIDVK